MSGFIANQFRKPTGIFGKLVGKLMIKGNGREYNELIPKMDIKTGDKLMEIGYGHGWGIAQISATHDCHITGIDFSEAMYHMAAKRNKEFMNLGKVVLLHGDFNDFTGRPEAFNKVYCLNVIYFWNDLLKPFTNIFNLLVPSGMFYFTMASREDLNRLKFTDDAVFNKYSIEQVVEALEAVGFQNVQYEYDWVYIVKCQKPITM